MSAFLHILLLLAIGFRILLFSQRGRHKPLIAVIAYLIMISAFSEALLAMSHPHSISPAQLLLEACLALTLYAHHGNVAELFKASKNNSVLSRLLCWSHQRKRKSRRKDKSVGVSR